jgi:glycosyltransferase involved in cell wall biosynthesis
MTEGASHPDATKPLVSVIIPTRDRLALLKEAVGSVLAQTLHSCEVVVVDDTSSDGTAGWLAEREGERVIAVVLDEHRERSFARNKGLEAARGLFVLFLDDDDRLVPSALAKLTSAVRRYPGSVGAVGARVLFEEGGNRRRVPHPRWSFKRNVWTDLLAGWTCPPGAILWKAEIMRDAGGWNEEVAGSEDYEFWLRLSPRGPLAFIPSAVLEKRTHSAQRRRGVNAHRENVERWRTKYIDGLPAGEQRVARRLLETSRLLNDARGAHGELESRKALSLYWQAIRLSPSVLTSPLLGPQIARTAAKSFAGLMVGRNGLSRARQTKQTLARALRRSVAEKGGTSDTHVPPQ